MQAVLKSSTYMQQLVTVCSSCGIISSGGSAMLASTSSVGRPVSDWAPRKQHIMCVAQVQVYS